MIPEELMAALGGGAGPAGPGGIPPELLGALGGAPGAIPEEEPAAPQGDPEEMYRAAVDATDDPETLVRWSLSMARKAAELEPDDEDTLAYEKATTALAQVLANRQKEQDGLIQGKSTPKAVRRVAGSY